MTSGVAEQPIAVDEPTAARMLGISSKTLGRLARDRERVGRLKIGTRVLYDVATLRSWLEEQAERQRTVNSN